VAQVVATAGEDIHSTFVAQGVILTQTTASFHCQPFTERLARWADNDGSHVKIPQGDALGWAKNAPLGQAECRQKTSPHTRDR
jgi:hypothetical protein